MAVSYGEVTSRQRIAEMRQVNLDKEEAVVYYRKPKVHPRTGAPVEEAGWITLADSQDLKMKTYLGVKGYQMLERYGRVTDSRDKWAPILSHPEGPSEFPLDQIMTSRWYDAQKLRAQWPSMPPGTNPVRLFPQLRGQEVIEYPCPECFNTTFLKPEYLARHLAILHNYDRININELGTKLGIDFSRTMREAMIKTVAFDDLDDDEPEVDPGGFRITTQDVPARRGPGRPPKAAAPAFIEEDTE